MADVLAETTGWSARRDHHRHDQAAALAAAATQQETPMPVLADASHAAHMIADRLASMASNPLMAHLAEEQLGHYLSDAEIIVVVTLVRTLEGVRKAPVQPMQVQAQQLEDAQQPTIWQTADQ